MVSIFCNPPWYGMTEKEKEKKSCSPDWLGVTVWVCHLPTCSLLSAEPTPWVNEAGLTPSHARTTPSQCPNPGYREVAHVLLRKGRATLTREAPDITYKLPFLTRFSSHSFLPRMNSHSRMRGSVHRQPSPLLPTQDSPPDGGLQAKKAASCPAISWDCLDKLSYTWTQCRHCSVTSKVTLTRCLIISEARDAL